VYLRLLVFAAGGGGGGGDGAPQLAAHTEDTGPFVLLMQQASQPLLAIKSAQLPAVSSRLPPEGGGGGGEGRGGDGGGGDGRVPPPPLHEPPEGVEHERQHTELIGPADVRPLQPLRASSPQLEYWSVHPTLGGFAGL